MDDARDALCVPGIHLIPGTASVSGSRSDGGLAFEEREQVGVDLVLVRRAHAVRRALVDLRASRP